MDPPLISEAARDTIFDREEPVGAISPADEQNRIDGIDLVVCTVTIGVVLVACYFALAGNMFHPLFLSVAHSGSLRAVVRPSLLWAATGSLFLVFRTVLWFSYRPFPSATRENAPTLTVIIPAYNEGRMVRNAIYSVLEADYPRDRLEALRRGRREHR